ncbi:hypothetical protein DFS34DRAFT_589378 [Phlyctochytrium arcticum]|nr:hypothetical protein DFS34DRAFT_589378 [Phlyctochytrium arcticum]
MSTAVAGSGSVNNNEAVVGKGHSKQRVYVHRDTVDDVRTGESAAFLSTNEVREKEGGSLNSAVYKANAAHDAFLAKLAPRILTMRRRTGKRRNAPLILQSSSAEGTSTPSLRTLQSRSVGDLSASKSRRTSVKIALVPNSPGRRWKSCPRIGYSPASSRKPRVKYRRRASRPKSQGTTTARNAAASQAAMMGQTGKRPEKMEKPAGGTRKTGANVAPAAEIDVLSQRHGEHAVEGGQSRKPNHQGKRTTRAEAGEKQSNSAACAPANSTTPASVSSRFLTDTIVDLPTSHETEGIALLAALTEAAAVSSRPTAGLRAAALRVLREYPKWGPTAMTEMTQAVQAALWNLNGGPPSHSGGILTLSTASTPNASANSQSSVSMNPEDYDISIRPSSADLFSLKNEFKYPHQPASDESMHFKRHALQPRTPVPIAYPPDAPTSTFHHTGRYSVPAIPINQPSPTPVSHYARSGASSRATTYTPRPFHHTQPGASPGPASMYQHGHYSSTPNLTAAPSHPHHHYHQPQHAQYASAPSLASPYMQQQQRPQPSPSPGNYRPVPSPLWTGRKPPTMHSTQSLSHLFPLQQRFSGAPSAVAPAPHYMHPPVSRPQPAPGMAGVQTHPAYMANLSSVPALITESAPVAAAPPLSLPPIHPAAHPTLTSQLPAPSPSISNPHPGPASINDGATPVPKATSVIPRPAPPSPPAQLGSLGPDTHNPLYLARLDKWQRQKLYAASVRERAKHTLRKANTSSSSSPNLKSPSQSTEPTPVRRRGKYFEHSDGEEDGASPAPTVLTSSTSRSALPGAYHYLNPASRTQKPLSVFLTSPPPNSEPRPAPGGLSLAPSVESLQPKNANQSEAAESAQPPGISELAERQRGLVRRVSKSLGFIPIDDRVEAANAKREKMRAYAATVLKKRNNPGLRTKQPTSNLLKSLASPPTTHHSLPNLATTFGASTQSGALIHPAGGKRLIDRELTLKDQQERRDALMKLEADHLRGVKVVEHIRREFGMP